MVIHSEDDSSSKYGYDIYYKKYKTQQDLNLLLMMIKDIVNCTIQIMLFNI